MRKTWFEAETYDACGVHSGSHNLKPYFILSGDDHVLIFALVAGGITIRTELHVGGNRLNEFTR